jgi:hypothetical protein
VKRGAHPVAERGPLSLAAPLRVAGSADHLGIFAGGAGEVAADRFGHQPERQIGVPAFVDRLGDVCRQPPGRPERTSAQP